MAYKTMLIETPLTISSKVNYFDLRNDLFRFLKGTGTLTLSKTNSALLRTTNISKFESHNLAKDLHLFITISNTSNFVVTLHAIRILINSSRYTILSPVFSNVFLVEYKASSYALNIYWNADSLSWDYFLTPPCFLYAYNIRANLFSVRNIF